MRARRNGHGRIARSVRSVMVLALVAGWALLVAAPVRAEASVPLDPTFGAGTGHAGYADVVSDLAAVPLADGGLLAVVAPSGPLVELRPDGSPNPAFGSAATPGAVQLPLVAPAQRLAVAPNGDIVVGDGSTVVRVAADGSSVRDAVAGLRAIDYFDSIRILGFEPSGRLLVAAVFSQHDHAEVVARLGADGALDTSYAPGGPVVPGLAAESGLALATGGLAVQPDGGVVRKTAPNGRLARLRPDGSPDPTFGGVGSVDLAAAGTDLEVDDTSFDAQGNLLLAGVTIPSCTSCAWISRISSAGVLDTTFAANATAAAKVLEGVAGIVDLGDGHAAVYGHPPAAVPAILVLGADGRADPGYGWQGAVNGLLDVGSGSASGMAIDGTGRLLLTGLTLPGSTHGSIARTARVGLRFAATTPRREVDTRVGLGGRRLQAGETASFRLPDLPAGASAATFNLTAADTDAPGFLTAFPCGHDLPNTSSVNFAGGEAGVPNQVTVGVESGQVCVFAFAAADVIIDLAGSFASGAGSAFVAATGRRWDSRAQGGFDPSGRVLALDFSDAPAGATAVSLNVTADQVSGAGWVAATPCDVGSPSSSNLNPRPGRITAGHVTVALGADRRVCLTTYAPLQLVVDLTGWWTTSAPGAMVTSGPDRIVDTRVGLGGGELVAGETRQLIATRPGILVVNVTATEATAAGWLAIFPCDVGFEGTSTVNFVPGQNVANAVLVDASHGVCATAYRPVHVLVDLAGSI